MLSDAVLVRQPWLVAEALATPNNLGMPSELWERIRAVRLRRKLSQEAFGADLGVSKSAVSQWENPDPDRRTVPELFKLQELARVHRVDLGWLLDDASSATPAHPPLPHDVQEPQPRYTHPPFGGTDNSPATAASNAWPRKVFQVVRTWESLMHGPYELQFETQVPDASMAPEIRKGATIVCVTGVQPEPGDLVVVTDRSGHHYLREYREDRNGTFEAHALNPAYLPLHSERDGLQVIAVFNGVLGRRAHR